MSTPASPAPRTDGAQLLTAPQAARLLGVHLSTIRRWIRERKLPAYRIGEKGVRVRASDVALLISPLHATPENGEHTSLRGRDRKRRLSVEDQQRGLAILADLEQLDREFGPDLLPDSTEFIHQMREERTEELRHKLAT